MAFKYMAEDPYRPNLWEFEKCRKSMSTSLAVLVEINGSRVWLPKSKIKLDEYPDGTCSVAMPEWLAKEKKLL